MKRALVIAVLVTACGNSKPVVEPGPGGDDAAPAAAADAAAAQPEPIGTPFGDGTVDARLVNEPGKVVTLDRILVPGKVTVLDFYADWCGACKVMEKLLLEELSGVDGVVVRKLDLVDDVSEASTYYQVGRALPETWIFDQQGNKVHVLRGGDVKDAGRLAKELAGRAAGGQ